MNQKDAEILAALQNDSRQSISKMAEEMGMSSSACHRRMQSLEGAGYILGYGARLSAPKLGLKLHALIDITLSSQSKEAMERFEAAVQERSEILECLLISGQADYRLRLALRDLDDFNRAHRECLADLPGISSVQTAFVIRPVKEWQGYALP